MILRPSGPILALGPTRMGPYHLKIGQTRTAPDQSGKSGQKSGQKSESENLGTSDPLVLFQNLILTLLFATKLLNIFLRLM